MLDYYYYSFKKNQIDKQNSKKMEAAYGIGVQNRYALFLEEDDVDPYAVLSAPASANVGHAAAELNESKKGSTAAGGGAHSTNKSTTQPGLTNKSTLSGPANTSPHSKSTNSQTQKHSSALSESKQNVVANQKSDSGLFHFLFIFLPSFISCFPLIPWNSFFLIKNISFPNYLNYD